MFLDAASTVVFNTGNVIVAGSTALTVVGTTGIMNVRWNGLPGNDLTELKHKAEFISFDCITSRTCRSSRA